MRVVPRWLYGALRSVWHLLFNPDADPPRVIVAAAVAFAVAVLTPLLWVVLQALQIDPTTGLAVVTAPTTVAIAANSLLLVTAVTVLGVAIAVPLAFLTVLADLPHRRAWTVLVALPLVIPSYVGAFAYVSSVGPRGALAVPLRWLGLEVASIEGLGGTVLVLTLYTYPYVFLTTRAALISFNRRQLEAAWALQASTPRALVQVVIPQIIPAITAGALLAALYTLSDFGTPAIMRFDVFTRAIYLELNTFGVGRAHASVLALQLVALTAVILWMEARLRGGQGGGVVVAPDLRPLVELGRYRRLAQLAPAMVVTAAIAVPIIVLLVWLVRAPPPGVGQGLAFEWGYVLNSVGVAVVAAVVTVLVAMPIAYYAGRRDGRVAQLVERATYVGYAVPGVVIGLGLVVFATQWVRSIGGVSLAQLVYQSIPLLVFAYVVRFLPQAVGSTRSSVVGVDRDLVGAAWLLGSTPVRAFRRVTLPLISPGVLTGGALVFLTTMKELDATLILHPAGFTTIVTYIWRVQEAGYYELAAVPALVLIGVSALAMIPLIGR
ncbi:MAG: iron ABC transporter permease [Haloquadratum sp.]|nr:iron ABC transporter permease [Haloferacaceae archaeon]MDR9444844.1 iron ABC transporter permease [Haloquadratum sp.]